RGRLQQRAIVARTSDGAIWLLRDDAPPDELLATIERQIFREDVRLFDRSDAWTFSTRYRSTTRGEPDEALVPGTIGERHGVPVRMRTEDGTSFALGSSVDDIFVRPRSESERIPAGRPRHGHEIHSDFNPFEVGLAREVHLDKGCFTGQEALLRMMTYGGVRRRLALLEAEGEAPDVRAALEAKGEPAGVVTSVVSNAGGWIGLGVVRRDPVDARAGFTLGPGERPIRVTPFPDARPLGL